MTDLLTPTFLTALLAAAVVGLAGSWTSLAFTGQGVRVPARAGAVMLGVGAYVVTRPS